MLSEGEPSLDAIDFRFDIPLCCVYPVGFAGNLEGLDVIGRHHQHFQRHACRRKSFSGQSTERKAIIVIGVQLNCGDVKLRRHRLLIAPLRRPQGQRSDTHSRPVFALVDSLEGTTIQVVYACNYFNLVTGPFA